MSGREVNLTEGDLLKPVLTLSLPIVLSMLMQVGYNLADTFWVGQVSAEAVAALSFSWPLVFLMISVGGGFSVAGTVLVAQNKGAGNHDRVDHVAGQTLTFVTLVSAFFAILGWILSPTLLSLIGADPGSNVFVLSVEYTRSIFLGLTFVFVFFMFQSLLRGWGDTTTPMYLMALGVAINVVLDPFLILGFQGNPLFGVAGLRGIEASLLAATGFTGMGVQGAAVATVASRGFGAVVGLWLLFSGTVGIELTLADLKPNPETVRKIVEIGAPTSVEQSTRALGVTVMTLLVATAAANTVLPKDSVVAAFGIGSRLLSLVFLPAMGLAKGTETVVGQNLGAEKPERAERGVFYTATIIAVAMALVSVVAYVFAEPIVSVFITGDQSAEVVQVGVDYLHIIAPTFAFMGVFRIVNGGFRGAGSTRTAMMFSLLSLWGLRLPPAIYLVTQMGWDQTAVWYSIAFANVAAVFVAGAWFMRGTWKDNVVDQTRGPAVADD
jgi:putative MATE family efflux protein